MAGEVPAVAGSVDSAPSGMLHIVQGTAGESPLGEVNAAQVQCSGDVWHSCEE